MVSILLLFEARCPISFLRRDIVKGLRDDDAESLYTSHRGSFDSQFSDTRDDGMKVFFKPEHGRSGSKGSTSSFGLRKKQAETRPVTEVCSLLCHI